MNGRKHIKSIEHSVKELLDKDENLIRDAEIICLFIELLLKRKTGPDIDAVFNKYYTEYESPLFTEYKKLIKQYTDSQINPYRKNGDYKTQVVIQNMITPLLEAKTLLERLRTEFKIIWIQIHLFNINSRIDVREFHKT